MGRIQSMAKNTAGCRASIKDSSGEVCFCLLLHRIFKWLYVAESTQLPVYGGCSLWGMGSEDTMFYHRPVCVTLGKLLHQFLLIPNYLSFPFLSPVLACFVWPDCLVVRDYLFLGMYSS